LRAATARLELLVAWLSKRTGMALSEQQLRRLEERVGARVAELGEARHLRHLQGPGGAAELATLIEALVVPRTELFRDEGQLRALREHVLAPRVARVRRPLRLWSAGCATGEEVATLLLLLAETGADPASTVLGTDLSEQALIRARPLTFSEARLQPVPASLRERYFLPSRSGHSSLVPSLRERARFLSHNLMDEPYPAAPGGGFDLILCRNVLIYFTAESAAQAVERLAERLAPGGVLVLSATEPLLQVPQCLHTRHCGEHFFYVRSPESDCAVCQAVAARRAAACSALVQPPVPPAEAVQPVATEPVAALSTAEAGQQAGARTPSEAEALFARVLEGASRGELTPQAFDELGRCLVLDPDLAPARYLQGMLLEQRGDRAEAAQAYRRALRSLEQGRARPTPFFLNPARLQVACAHALERVGSPARLTPPVR
jgi:chemotaxis protein methyltransferase CheR